MFGRCLGKALLRRRGRREEFVGVVIELNGVERSWEEGEVRSTGTVLSSMGDRSGCQSLGSVLCHTHNRLQALAGRFGVRLPVVWIVYTIIL